MDKRINVEFSVRGFITRSNHARRKIVLYIYYNNTYMQLNEKKKNTREKHTHPKRDKRK